MAEVPQGIFRKPDGGIRPLGWLLLAVIVVDFAALWFYGIVPGHRTTPPV